MQELFNQIKSRLIRITGSLLRNEEDAADAVQETFCRIWQIRDRIRNEQEATAIAVQTAKNICIDQLRRKKVVHFEPLNTDHEKGETESLLLQIEAADEYRLVKELIEKALSPLQQKILEMKEIDGIEIEEISQKLNMQPTAVRMNLSRARKEIRNIYNKMNPL
ncbi:MAG: RNA polymerase sigma factor [Bacteroidales bacterium]